MKFSSSMLVKTFNIMGSHIPECTVTVIYLYTASIELTFSYLKHQKYTEQIKKH